MSLTERFKAGFECETPDYLPDALKRRLDFRSCLAEADDRAVYLVYDSETQSKAVLKIAFSAGPNNLRREYEILSRLKHPGVPTAICYTDDPEGRQYLLRGYAEGEMLSALLERDGVFSERQTLEIAREVCKVLSYLHGQKPPVIYRDISPWNIVITPNGKLSFVDFGISREDRKERAYDTRYAGNVAFASPENFGFAKTDSRSDIFALGRLILYLCTGNAELPNYEQRLSSPALRRIIDRCTRLSPEKRYRSVARLQRSIERLLNPPTRTEVITAAVGAAVIVTVGLSLWYGRQAPAPSAEPLSANGQEVWAEARIPVSIETRKNGRTYADCVVAVDNHHWYEPAQNGKAELWALGFNSYRIQAADGNQTLFTDAAVTREVDGLSFAFDFADAPVAPEYLRLSFAFGTRSEYPLDIVNAEEAVLTGQPNGVSVVRADSGFVLVTDAAVENAGHYLMFLESTNARGRAITTVSLTLADEKPVTIIRTPQQLNNVRNNLAGNYKLEADIDLSEFSAFEPIGSAEHPFTGRFDGGGFSVSGLRVYGVSNHSGLFGYIVGGAVTSLTVHEPQIQANHALYLGTAAIVGYSERGLIDDCAVIGGSVEADVRFDSGVGGVCGVNRGSITNCISSARLRVTDNSHSGLDSVAGGIAGENRGYIAACGNTGGITSASIAGGIAGFSDMGVITRCFNTGRITAPAYAGDYLPGGIVQLLGRGKYVSDCFFLKGTAPVGATVWNGGVLMGIRAEEAAFFEDVPALLQRLSQVGG